MTPFPPRQGCYVRGLYLEGARWDAAARCLRPSHPKVLVTELPIMHVLPVEAHKLKLQVRIRRAIIMQIGYEICLMIWDKNNFVIIIFNSLYSRI